MFSMAFRRSMAVGASACALAFGLSAIPASAQTQQRGLVNVSLSNTTIQVPIGVAANICDVTANVIASNSFTGNESPCTAITSPTAEGGGGGGGNTTQHGLVNVSLSNTTIQVPVGVAANVCNVTANVITSGILTSNEGLCTAISSPSADA